MMVAPQPESSARCPASLPIFMDFACGAQSGLPSGTRSKVWRVLIISWSNSASSASRMAMVFLLKGDVVRHILPQPGLDGRAREKLLRRDAEFAGFFHVAVGHARSIERRRGASLAVQENQP